MGAKSPLLWDDGQVEEYLAGSPLVAEIKERLKASPCLFTPLFTSCICMSWRLALLWPFLQGIEKEYAELDTVWFMAGSLFKNYPYDVPTEAFSLDLFRQVTQIYVLPTSWICYELWRRNVVVVWWWADTACFVACRHSQQCRRAWCTCRACRCRSALRLCRWGRPC